MKSESKQKKAPLILFFYLFMFISYRIINKLSNNGSKFTIEKYPSCKIHNFGNI